jgi:ankyrin repeat protein
VILQSHVGGKRRQAWVATAVALAVMVVVATACRRPPPPEAARPLQPADKELLAAAEQGVLDRMKAAVAAGADVKCRGTNGLTALVLVACGHPGPLDGARRAGAAFLLQHGAAVDATDPDGRTALIWAARAGDLETAQMLVDAGAGIKRRDRSYKTAMLNAAETGHRDILVYLGRTLKVQQRANAW